MSGASSAQGVGRRFRKCMCSKRCMGNYYENSQHPGRNPSPPPLDSGLRRNDGGAWTPAQAGMTVEVCSLHKAMTIPVGNVFLNNGNSWTLSKPTGILLDMMRHFHYTLTWLLFTFRDRRPVPVVDITRPLGGLIFAACASCGNGHPRDSGPFLRWGTRFTVCCGFRPYPGPRCGESCSRQAWAKIRRDPDAG